jgi:hypothetical protein
MGIALFHLARGEAELARSAAATAVAAHVTGDRTSTSEHRLCLAIEDSAADIFGALLEVWLGNPMLWSAIENVARAMPAELTGSQIEILTECLHRVARAKAPILPLRERTPRVSSERPTSETK